METQVRTATGIIRNGQVVLDFNPGWPDGTRVIVRSLDEDSDMILDDEPIISTDEDD